MQDKKKRKFENLREVYKGEIEEKLLETLICFDSCNSSGL